MNEEKRPTIDPCTAAPEPVLAPGGEVPRTIAELCRSERPAAGHAGSRIGAGAPSAPGAYEKPQAIEPVIKMHGSRNKLTYTRDGLAIGCQLHRIRYWKEHGREIGRQNGYYPEQIDEYMALIDLVEAYVGIIS